MRQSNLFWKSIHNLPSGEVSKNSVLLIRAGFISKLSAGVYSYLPLGLKVLNKIESIVREEMNRLGSGEVFLPSLHPKANWQTTGRWDSLDVLFKLPSEEGSDVALGATHEEVVTPLASEVIGSYKDLPKSVFQIQTKFRNEPRAKSGLLRGREFRMKDLYSFHRTQEDLDLFYEQAQTAYANVYKRLGLNALLTEASGGTFSKFSHEYQVEIPSGEDTIYICEECGLAKNKEVFTEGVICSVCSGAVFRETKASEVGNIFKLGTKYSEPFKFLFTTESGNKAPVIMGCYGIGTSRLMGVLAEKFGSDSSMIWPVDVAPFKVHLVVLDSKDASVRSSADVVYQDLVANGVDVLYDDREKPAGEKFADSDLLGIPFRLVVSSKTLETNSLEFKNRITGEVVLRPLSLTAELQTALL